MKRESWNILIILRRQDFSIKVHFCAVDEVCRGKIQEGKIMPKNCWEYKGCGRQAGGTKAQELGVCPASIEQRAHQINHGTNAGRTCWAVAGTLCKGEKQGTFAQKVGNCSKCDFYLLVAAEEGSGAIKARDLLTKLG
jgi:hypothetical protein